MPGPGGRSRLVAAASALAAVLAWLAVAPASTSGTSAGAWQTTQIVSVSSSEQQADSGSVNPRISGNGNFVAFTSGASNLVPGDNDPEDFFFQTNDVFVRDLAAGTTEMVNLTSDGDQLPGEEALDPAISDNGRYVLFSASGDMTGAIQHSVASHLYIRDRQLDTLKLLDVDTSGGDSLQGSYGSDLSGDGAWAVFFTPDDAIIPGRESNCGTPDLPHPCFDVFLVNTVQGTISLVSHGLNGEQLSSDSSLADPRINDDGRYAVYRSSATGLVADDDNDFCGSQFLPPNCLDIFLYDRVTDTNSLISRSSQGEIANDASSTPVISGNGRYVAYASEATNLVPEEDPAACPDPAPNCNDVYIYDRTTDETRLVSATAGGEPANGHSGNPSISQDGRYVAFQSTATNLVPGADLSCIQGDDGQRNDICQNDYVKDMVTGEVTIVSVKANGQAGDYDSVTPSISDDGQRIAFISGATDLVPNDNNTDCHNGGTFYDCEDVFLAERQEAATATPATITAVPTITPAPGSGKWGDHDCDGTVTSRDNQALQRYVLQQPPLSQTEPCPDLGATVEVEGFSPHKIGDNDCDNDISSRDNQALLRFVLQQPPLSQTEPCPDLGQEISAGGPTPTPTEHPTVTPHATPTPHSTQTSGPTVTPTATATPGRTITPHPTVTAPTVTLPPLTASPTPEPTPVENPPTNECGVVGSPVTISDNGADGPAVLIATFTDDVAITDVAVCVNVDHTWVGDLVVSFEHSETATIVTLLDRPGAPPNPGCNGANLRILFRDSGANGAEGTCNSSPAISGTYKPVDAMSAFDGQSSAGTWYLYVSDFKAGNVGTVTGAYIWFNYP